MEEDHENETNSSPNSNSSPNFKSKRPRSNTDHSEDTLTAAEKMDLLNSFPVDELDKASHHDEVPNVDVDVDNFNRKDEDVIEMFGTDSDSDGDGSDASTGSTGKSLQPRSKRARIDTDADADANANSNTNTNANHETNAQKEQLLIQAKSRLSKWAARLFDPNRPRGLVEAPEVIPLNDEFLTSFGKREKEFDDKIGNKVEFDDDDLDNFDGILSDKEDDEENGDGGEKKKKNGTKVRYCNECLVVVAIFGSHTHVFLRPSTQTKYEMPIRSK